MRITSGLRRSSSPLWKLNTRGRWLKSGSVTRALENKKNTTAGQRNEQQSRPRQLGNEAELPSGVVTHAFFLFSSPFTVDHACIAGGLLKLSSEGHLRPLKKSLQQARPDHDAQVSKYISTGFFHTNCEPGDGQSSEALSFYQFFSCTYQWWRGKDKFVTIVADIF